MAVSKKQPDLIRDYWPRYRRQSLLIVVVLQLVIATLLIAFLVLTNLIILENALSLLFIALTVLAIVSVNILLFRMLTRPLKQITNALMYVSNEQGAAALENPNTSPKLKPILEAIYSINPAEADSKVETTSDSEAVDSVELPVGVAYLDQQANVIYANQHAPVKIGTDEKKVLSLFFQTDTSLKDWVAQCEKKVLKAQKSWKRIPNDPLGSPDRKVYRHYCFVS